MIKLIAIDMDGTLLNDDKQIPQANKEVLQKVAQKGVKIVLCTGRMKPGVIPYFDELGIGDYAILNNGCSTYATKDWSLVDTNGVSFEEIELLLGIAQEYPGIYLTLITDNHFYVFADHVPEIVAYDASLVFTEAIAIDLADLKAKKEPIFQAMFLGDERVLDQFQKEQEEKLASLFSVVRSQPYIFEAMPKGVTKASALSDLATRFEILPENIMALGDGNNDLEMLAYAGLGVAMGNATEQVKAITSHQTSSNNEAGVAKAIETYVLNPLFD
ncbi:Cof-type HAD-IIB family hydrolase [Streptococcus sp. sy004]|uniref:Cof-type HAD-IIB family hydrolase n=1 Tax=Streptococcus sp. sy004 TaxID=2600149 RepID=UPI0011B3AFC0|nr:Cof-type HAD-IIB family hydrolase [Streptococcus sp. sy004]TWT09880.1 HAD family phosphatase [Streptococcus sp. sy004]